MNYQKWSDVFLHSFILSPFPMKHMNISRYLTEGKGGEKILSSASLDQNYTDLLRHLLE